MILRRDDIQHISDLRLIALAMVRKWEKEHCLPDAQPSILVMQDIAQACEELIRAGPEEFRHIIEPTASMQQIQHELHRSVFGRERDIIDVR